MEDKKLTDSEVKTASPLGNTKVEKIKAIYPHINVSVVDEKPYYTICWYDIEKKTMDYGYGSFNLEYVCDWLSECFEVVESDFADLINRLEARIGVYETCNARKDEAIKHLEGEFKKLQAENERLKDYTITVEKEVDWYRDELRHSDKKVATKAYKEVFEKLNDKALVRKIKLFGNWFIVKGVTLHDINTLKKDMVGEDNA